MPEARVEGPNVSILVSLQRGCDPVTDPVSDLEFLFKSARSLTNPAFHVFEKIRQSQADPYGTGPVRVSVTVYCVGL